MDINITDLLLWERSLSGCNYKPASKVHNAIRAALKMHGTGRPFGIKSDRCEWKIDQDGFYNTSCKYAFAIYIGSPKENAMRYCPFCGLAIKEAQQVIQPDNAQ